MANLTETSAFDEGVYQLELTDPVIGGPNGISNQPLKNLANRTRYLKDTLDALVAGAPEGLNTFAELAAALGNDPTFTTTLANALALKAPIANPTFTGNPAAPTPAQFDNDTSLATTEFVQRALGSMRAATGLSANTTLTAVHIGQMVQCASAGPYTITLPSVSGVPDGASIELVSSASGTITIARQGSDVIYPNLGAGVASITLGNGDTARLVKITGGWALIGGSASLRYSNADFGRSLSINGWQRLPSGLIIQWGRINTSASAPTFATFPIAFTTSNYAYALTPDWDNPIMHSIQSREVGSFAVNTWNASGARIAVFNVSFIVIGY